MNTTPQSTPTAAPVSPRPRYHYAAHWPFGVATHANTGRPIRTVARFSTAAARDAWVYAGNPYQTNAGYRESVSREEIKPDLRRSAKLAPQGKALWSCDWGDGSEFLV